MRRSIDPRTNKLEVGKDTTKVKAIIDIEEEDEEESQVRQLSKA